MIVLDVFSQEIFVSKELATNTTYFGAQSVRDIALFDGARNVVSIFYGVSDTVNSFLVLPNFAFFDPGVDFEGKGEFFVFSLDASPTGLLEAQVG